MTDSKTFAEWIAIRERIADVISYSSIPRSTVRAKVEQLMLADVFNFEAFNDTISDVEPA